MEGFLTEVENLMQDSVNTRDVSTTAVISQLRDLAHVLDKLPLEHEYLLVGNYALDLSQL
jgi:hypothetical protein